MKVKRRGGCSCRCVGNRQESGDFGVMNVDVRSVGMRQWRQWRLSGMHVVAKSVIPSQRTEISPAQGASWRRPEQP